MTVYLPIFCSGKSLYMDFDDEGLLNFLIRSRTPNFSYTCVVHQMESGEAVVRPKVFPQFASALDFCRFDMSTGLK